MSILMTIDNLILFFSSFRMYEWCTKEGNNMKGWEPRDATGYRLSCDRDTF